MDIQAAEISAILKQQIKAWILNISLLSLQLGLPGLGKGLLPLLTPTMTRSKAYGKDCGCVLHSIMRIGRRGEQRDEHEPRRALNARRHVAR